MPGIPNYEPHVIPGVAPSAPPNPETVRTNIQNQLTTSPQQALSALNRHGHILKPAERDILTRQAINELAGRAEKGEPVAGLQSVRQARQGVGNLSPQATRQLQAMEARLEERALAATLNKIIQLRAAHLKDPGQLAEAGLLAQNWLGSAPANTNPAAQPHLALVHEAQGHLRTLADLGREANLHAGVQVKLAAALKGTPAQRAAALQDLDFSGVPAAVHAPLRGLRGVAELQAVAEVPWQKPPDVGRLQQSIALLEQGLAEVPGANSALGSRVRQDLAVKAFLEGHTVEARKLLAGDSDPAHATNLLRDLKTVLTGDGELGTWPGQRVVAGGPGEGPGAPRGPPQGMRSLIPEADTAGWRPPARASTRAGLPPLEEAVHVGKQLEQKVEAHTTQQWNARSKRAAETFEHLDALHQGITSYQQADRATIAKLEERLGRQLEPVERALTSHLRQQGRGEDQLLAALEQEDEELNKLVAQLSEALGRPVLPEERAQIRTWRRQGVSFTEMVTRLRAGWERIPVPRAELPPADAPETGS